MCKQVSSTYPGITNYPTPKIHSHLWNGVCTILSLANIWQVTAASLKDITTTHPSPLSLLPIRMDLPANGRWTAPCDSTSAGPIWSTHSTLQELSDCRAHGTIAQGINKRTLFYALWRAFSIWFPCRRPNGEVGRLSWWKTATKS